MMKNLINIYKNLIYKKNKYNMFKLQIILTNYYMIKMNKKKNKFIIMIIKIYKIYYNKKLTINYILELYTI